MSEKLYFFIKRVVDLVSGTLLAILFLPTSIIVAILIKTYDGGPIFADIPSRVGKNGKKFKLYKFRSMVENAHKLLQTDPRYKKLYEKYKKGSFKLSIEEDPRITPVGKFIRRHSIDEFPQLINVLRGEMSLIGPRAYYPDELEEQCQKFPKVKSLIKDVLSVKPGITGLWQVSGRNEINFDKRIELDAYYAKKKSLLLDLWILLKTPWIVIAGQGAI